MQNFSGWNPSGFVEDNPELRCGTWLSRAAVVGPVADRKPNRTPMCAADMGFKLGGCKASGCLFFPPINVGPLKPQVKFPLQEEEVFKWIESRLGVMAVTNTRLSTNFCGMTQWDWVTFLGPVNILGMFLVISAELTWLHVRPDCTFGSRATRAAESFQGWMKDLSCPFPVNSKSFCCLHHNKWCSLVNAKSTLKIT